MVLKRKTQKLKGKFKGKLKGKLKGKPKGKLKGKLKGKFKSKQAQKQRRLILRAHMSSSSPRYILSLSRSTNTTPSGRRSLLVSWR